MNVIVWVWSVVVLVLAASAPNDFQGEAQSLLRMREPIVIASDDDFRLENGVVGGDGSPHNPFRIEGWRIVSPLDNGISISNTTKYVEVSGNQIIGALGGDPFSAGIRLSNVGNITVRLNDIIENFVGVHCAKCSDSAILFNHIRGLSGSTEGTLAVAADGIHLRQAMDVLIGGNRIKQVAWGIAVEDSSARVIIQENHVEAVGLGQAISLHSNVTNAEIVRNSIERAPEGIALRGAARITVEDNILTNVSTGVTWDPWSAFGDHYPTSNLAITGNRIYHADVGISGFGATNVSIIENFLGHGSIGMDLNHALDAQSNAFVNNTVAVRVFAQGTGTFNDNSFLTNGNVAVEAWADVEMLLNWWGSESGPRADEIIENNGAVVRYDPWLLESPT